MWGEFGDLATLPDGELLRLLARLNAEARRRKLNTTVGQVGEALVIDLFARRPDLPKLMPAATGTKNVDALSRSGDRYSIKTIQYGGKSGTVYPDSSNRDRQLFEFIVVAVIDAEMALQRAVVYDWEQFVLARKWDVRMGAWYISRSKKSLGLGTEIHKTDAGVDVI